MKSMTGFVANMTGSSAEISAGNVTGVLVRATRKEDVNDVFFGYKSPNESINVGGIKFILTFTHVVLSVSECCRKTWK